MKNIFIKLFSFLILGMGTTGCNYLDIVPDNTIEISSLFENRDQAYKALSTCYSYMPNFEKVHESMSLAGDEYVPRLDADIAEDRGFGRGEKLMRGWQSSNDPILSYWDGKGGAKSLYQGIRTCNIFFENINNVPDLLPDEKQDWIAQVKVLRAYYHFFLIRIYGPIVISEKNLEPSAPVDEVRQERQTIETCFKFVVDEINSVLYGENGTPLTDLPERRESSFLGQIDQVIAKALKAQVLLYQASPLFNGNSEYYNNFKGYDGELLFPMENDKEKWKTALDAIDEAITAAAANGKKLYEYKGLVKYWDTENVEKSDILQYCYNNRFSITDPWNDELIWGYSGLDFEGQGGFAHATQMRSVAEPTTPEYAWQWLGASYRMAEMFYSNNGVPINDDKTYEYEHRLDITEIPDDTYHRGYMQPGEKTLKLHLNREPRFYAWMTVDRSVWRTHDILNDVKMRYDEMPGGRGSSHNTDFYWTGISTKKMVHPESKSGAWQRVIKYPYPIIRLADLYLMYAEAYNEYYGPHQKVYEMLNKVRTRAGLTVPIEQVWADGTIVKNPGKHTTQTGLREIIQDERQIELSFEGHRYYDILRWKRADEFFISPIKGWNVTGRDASQFYQLTTLQPRVWQTPKNYLFPLPISETNRNPKLVQNPEW